VVGPSLKKSTRQFSPVKRSRADELELSKREIEALGLEEYYSVLQILTLKVFSTRSNVDIGVIKVFYLINAIFMDNDV
jgi:hypothetical protein